MKKINVKESFLSISLTKDKEGGRYDNFELRIRDGIVDTSIKISINQLRSLKNSIDFAFNRVKEEQGITNQFGDTISNGADYNLYYCNKCDLTNDAPGKKCVICGGDTVKVEGKLKKDFDVNSLYGKSIANGEAEKLDKENIKLRNYLLKAGKKLKRIGENFYDNSLKEAKETLSGDALNEYLLLHSESKCRSMSGDALESLGIRSIFADKDEEKQTETPFFDAFGNKLYLGDKLIMDDEKDDPCIMEWNGYKYVLNFSGEKFDTDPSNNNRLVKINN